MRIEGRTILVTGGSAGIGRALALRLASKGANVLIVGRDQTRMAEVVAEAPGRIVPLSADLSQPDELERLLITLRSDWPELSVLINNAAMQVNMSPSGIGDDGLMSEFRREIAVNLTAPVALSLGLMPGLARQDAAAVVNISSGLAIAPKRTAPVYCATKAALRSFTRALRYRCEDAAPSLRVMDVIMALVETSMTTGRGAGKISAEAAAAAIIAGLERDRSELWVGKSRVLGGIYRFWPGLAYRMLRNG